MYNATARDVQMRVQVVLITTTWQIKWQNRKLLTCLFLNYVTKYKPAKDEAS